MELRKSLGASEGLVQADRDSVSLGPVVTDLETETDLAREALRTGRDFLEGIDVADPAFGEWLRDERARVAVMLGLQGRASPPASDWNAAAPPFVLSMGALPEGPARFAARELGQAIARLVAEFLDVEVFGSGNEQVPEGLPPAGLTLHIEGVEIQTHYHMMVSLILRSTGQTVWSQRLALGGSQDVDEGRNDVPELVFQAAEAAVMQMPRMAGMPNAGVACQVNGMIARAIASMFSYDAARLREADAFLAEASSLIPSGRIDAWRSLVRQIMYIERTEGPRDRLIAEADAFARAALEHANGNPLVLALVSQTRVMVDTNPDAGTVLARDAVRLSPFNAFGYWSAAGAEFFHKRYDEGLATARKGIAISSRTSFSHWWEALAGVAAMNGGHVAAAVAHCEAAFYRAPNFRAAMRHLVYLHLEQGYPEKAARVLKSLLRAEPDFSPGAVLLSDYPAHTLRRCGLAAKHHDAVIALMPAGQNALTQTMNAPKG